MAIDPTQFASGSVVQPEVELLQPPSEIDVAEAAAFQPYEAAQAEVNTEYQAATVGSPTGYEAAQADVTTDYDAATVGAPDIGQRERYQATTVDPTAGRGEAVAGELSEGSFVENRIGGLLSRDSDYMRRARTAAEQQMNRRGLLSSSIATGAAHAAAIDAALPIASQDAATSAQMEMANAQFENQMAQLNAEQEGLNQRFNAGEINRVEYENASLDLEQRVAQAQMQLEADTFSAQQINEQRRTGMQTQADVGMFNVAQANEAERLRAQMGLEADIFSAQQLNEQRRTGMLTRADLETFNVGQANEARRVQAQTQAEIDMFNAGMAQEVSLAEADQNFRANQFNVQSINDINRFVASQINEQNFAVLQADLQMQLNQLDNELAFQLAHIEGYYQIEKNLDTINGALYQQFTESVGDILANVQDPEVAKQQIAALENATDSQMEFNTGGGGGVPTFSGGVYTPPTVATSGGIIGTPPGQTPRVLPTLSNADISQANISMNSDQGFTSNGYLPQNMNVSDGVRNINEFLFATDDEPQSVNIRRYGLGTEITITDKNGNTSKAIVNDDGQVTGRAGEHDISKFKYIANGSAMMALENGTSQYYESYQENGVLQDTYKAEEIPQDYSTGEDYLDKAINYVKANSQGKVEFNLRELQAGAPLIISSIRVFNDNNITTYSMNMNKDGEVKATKIEYEKDPRTGAILPKGISEFEF